MLFVVFGFVVRIHDKVAFAVNGIDSQGLEGLKRVYGLRCFLTAGGFCSFFRVLYQFSLVKLKQN